PLGFGSTHRTHHYYAQSGRFGERTVKKEGRKPALTLPGLTRLRDTPTTTTRRETALKSLVPVERRGQCGNDVPIAKNRQRKRRENVGGRREKKSRRFLLLAFFVTVPS